MQSIKSENESYYIIKRKWLLIKKTTVEIMNFRQDRTKVNRTESKRIEPN